MDRKKMKVGRMTIFPNTLAVLIVAFLVSTSAREGIGSDENGRYMIYGTGAHPCRNYVRVREMKRTKTGKNVNEAIALIDGWVDGYLSAFNRFSPDTYSIIPRMTVDELMGWVENYCKRHPDDKIATALEALAFEQYPQRQRKEPRPTTTGTIKRK